jgi:hypothetical protein
MAFAGPGINQLDIAGNNGQRVIDLMGNGRNNRIQTADLFRLGQFFILFLNII